MTKKLGQVGRIFFKNICYHYFLFYTKSMWNTETTFSQNLNTLKSLTKKLNYLFHIKWHRRRKSLTFSKQIYCKSSIIFCRFSQKKHVQCRYFLTGTVGQPQTEMFFVFWPWVKIWLLKAFNFSTLPTVCFSTELSYLKQMSTFLRNSNQESSTIRRNNNKVILLKQGAQLSLICFPEVIQKSACTLF